MSDDSTRGASPLIRKHLGYGWWALVSFVLLGLALEAMNGLKLGWYLDVDNATRREMFTLAHAHGTLLGLVNLGFAATLRALDASHEAQMNLASRCLLGAFLLPVGFLLGGLVVYGGDPGLGVLLSPIGGFLLLVATFLVARSLTRG